VYALLMVCTAPFGATGPRYFSGAWCRLMLRMARWICGIRHEITGWEHLPSGPFVLLAKHQSAWETMFFPAFFPPHVFVLKKELLSIPFFGWGMRVLDPIAIDRDQRREAFQQVLNQGQERLARGLVVVIFPEGTRVPYGYRGRYAPGGTLLAQAAGVPIVAMAHDAGNFWKKGILNKSPGIIHLAFAPPVSPLSGDATALNRAAENWIESQLEQWSGQTAKPWRRKTLP
jgi:1-acyl-sn-glycerol-3-phosphate acyltransferase